MKHLRWRDWSPAVALLGALLVPACGLQKARSAYEEGRYEAAAQHYKSLLDRDPNDVKARIGYLRATLRASEEHLLRARQAEQAGQAQLMAREVRAALAMDPSNALAREWMARLELEQQGTPPSDASRPPRAATAPPQTELSFAEPTSLKTILTAVSQAMAVRILFHPSYEDTAITANLRGRTFQQVLDLLMLRSGLLYQLADANTIVVFRRERSTAAPGGSFNKTFTLTHAKPAEVRSLFRTLLPQLKVTTEPHSNTIRLEAQPADLAVAARLINHLDRGQVEVMLYLELLEVRGSSLAQAGLQSPLGRGNLRRLEPAPAAAGAMLPFPAMTIQELKRRGEAQVVTSPNVRATAGNTVTVRLFDGDPGLTLRVSPLLRDADEVELTLQGGASADQNAATVARLRDGELAIFSGPARAAAQSSPEGHLLLTVRAVPVRQMALREEDFEVFDPAHASALPEAALPVPAVAEPSAESLPPGPSPSEEPMEGPPAGSESPAAPEGQDEGPQAETPPSGEDEAPPGVRPDAGETDSPQRQEPPADTENPTEPEGRPDGEAPPPEGAPPPDEAPPDEPREGTPETSQAPPAATARAPLTLFINPATTNASVGERVQLNIMVNGGKDLRAGSLDLRVDPKLKVVATRTGDFVSLEGGTLEVRPGADGSLHLAFSRPNGALESGVLVEVDLEPVSTGSASVTILGGRYQAADTTVPAQVTNATVTVN